MARLSQNLSQAALAEKAQLGVATIKRVELGESITLLTLIALLRALGELDQLNNVLRHYELNPQTNKKRIKTSINSAENQSTTPTNYDFMQAQLQVMCWRNK